jgi:hypothetical protein
MLARLFLLGGIGNPTHSGPVADEFADAVKRRLVDREFPLRYE